MMARAKKPKSVEIKVGDRFELMLDSGAAGEIEQVLVLAVDDGGVTVETESGHVVGIRETYSREQFVAMSRRIVAP